MKTVDIQDADLSALVEEAAAGEEILLEKAGKPFARLVPADEPEVGNEFAKGFGALKGHIWIDEDNFDAPLPPEILKGFGVEE